MGARGRAVIGDHHALARGQSVVLDHPGRLAGEPVQGRIQMRWVVHDFAARGAHPRGGHHVFGECLGAFDARGGGRGTEAGDARGPHGVGDTQHQRHLGADDHQVDVEGGGQGGNLGTGANIDGMLLGHGGGSRIARRYRQVVHAWVSLQGDRQSVFAATGSNNEDTQGLHAPDPSGRGSPGHGAG